MRTRTLLPGNLTTSMVVYGDLPYGPTGIDQSATIPFCLAVAPIGLGSAATPRQLTPAGIQAAILRINTYIAALSAANRDLMLRTFGQSANGGLIQLGPRLVTYPVLNYTDALAEVTAWATLLGTGANVEVF